ncbi:hypothetical protein K438DRAFT_1529662, partial [Mycena galopus ATCC 62051]
LQTVEKDPSVVAKQLDIQLHRLLLGPCQSMQGSTPPIFLIDGLDECESHGAQMELLRLISTVGRTYTFRFLIASRPEAHICETFDEPFFRGLLKATNVEQSFKDVQTYLRGEFTRIHREHRHTMCDIPTPWPSEDTVENLVAKSSGYFVYASTIIKFIDDEYLRPTEQLIAVQNLTTTAPFAALDQLYIQILSRVPAQLRSRLGYILGCALIIRGLGSLLNIDEDNEVVPHHASFADFLQ